MFCEINLFERKITGILEYGAVCVRSRDEMEGKSFWESKEATLRRQYIEIVSNDNKEK